MTSSGLLLGDRYQLAGRIAVGGMGEVWRATDLVLGRAVAVKLLRSGSGSEAEHARFRTEARHAGSLSHPGIACVYDYREADPPHPPYLVMELVDGPSLARVLDAGPVDAARTMGMIAQAAAALQFAHTAGLVHRDIKPGNLLVSQDGNVKITDFGIARAAGSASVTRPGALIGTPAYLAPERVTGAPAAPAADLYALGIVAYQCLTGRLPFEGPSLTVALAHLERPLPRLPAHVPAGVAALVADLTAKDPRARPASAAEVAARAERLLAALARTTAVQRAPHAAPAMTASDTDVMMATRPLPGWRGYADARQRRRPGRRAPAGSHAVLALAAIAVFAVGGWVFAGGHGRPQSAVPSATQQSAPAGSHVTHRAAPARRKGGTTGGDTPGQAGLSAASGKRHSSPTPSPDRGPTRTPTPDATPTPAGSHAPSATPTPTGTPAPSGVLSVSGTPSPGGTASSTGAPSPSGTPSQTGTPSPSGTQSQIGTSTAVPD
jgi:serine/threonine-protein kinase